MYIPRYKKMRMLYEKYKSWSLRRCMKGKRFIDESHIIIHFFFFWKFLCIYIRRRGFDLNTLRALTRCQKCCWNRSLRIPIYAVCKYNNIIIYEKESFENVVPTVKVAYNISDESNVCGVGVVMQRRW